MDLVHEWDDSVRSYLAQAFRKKPDLELITFQATRRCKGERLVSGMFELEGKVYSEKEMLENSLENTKWLRSVLDSRIRVGLENNNYYPKPAYEIVTEGEFISNIIRSNGLVLLLDIAHAMITAYNKKIKYEKYLESLPIKSLAQVHICQPDINNDGIAYDAHNAPEDSMINEMLSYMQCIDCLKYVTIEYYKDKDTLISSINRIKYAVRNAGSGFSTD
jgi:uncharacterized protein (UPF0276 family)